LEDEMASDRTQRQISELATALMAATGFERLAGDRKPTKSEMTRGVVFAIAFFLACKTDFEQCLATLARGHVQPASRQARDKEQRFAAMLDRLRMAVHGLGMPQPMSNVDIHRRLSAVTDGAALALAEYFFASCGQYVRSGIIGTLEALGTDYACTAYFKRYSAEQASNPTALVNDLLQSKDAPPKPDWWRHVCELHVNNVIAVSGGKARFWLPNPTRKILGSLPDPLRRFTKIIRGTRYSLVSESVGGDSNEPCVPDVGETPCSVLVFFDFVLLQLTGHPRPPRRVRPPSYCVTSLVLQKAAIPLLLMIGLGVTTLSLWRQHRTPFTQVSAETTPQEPLVEEPPNATSDVPLRSDATPRVDEVRAKVRPMPSSMDLSSRSRLDNHADELLRRIQDVK